MPHRSFRIEPLDTVVPIPYHFRCPISLELMRDPVTVCTGQTYDRASIESWVATGNTTCPVTRSGLTDFTLIPNHTLRRLIQEWCVAHRHFGVERIPTPKEAADPAAVRRLLARASSVTCPHVHRVAALRRLAGFARDSEKNRAVILDSEENAVEVLIRVAFSGGSGEIGVEAVAVLAAFPFTEAESEAVAGDPGRVGYLAGLLFHSSVEVRVDSAAVVEAVVSGTKLPELRHRVTSVDEIFDGVVEILRGPGGASYPRAVNVAVKALLALCLVKQTRRKAVAAGAAEALIDRLAETDDKVDAERALAAAELLCRLPEGCAAIGEHALAVPILVRVILKVSDKATEYAASALLALCSAAEKCRTEAVAAGVLTQLLLVVQSECTERAKRKAQMLLKLLRDAWPEYYAVANSDEHSYACSEVIPF